MQESSEVLKNAMERLNLTKQQLSDASGVAYMTISNILVKGVENARLQNVFAICKVLGINIVDLIEPAKMELIKPITMPPWGHKLVSKYEEANDAVRFAVCKLLDISEIDMYKQIDRAALAAQLQQYIDEDEAALTEFAVPPTSTESQ